MMQRKREQQPASPAGHVTFRPGGPQSAAPGQPGARQGRSAHRLPAGPPGCVSGRAGFRAGGTALEPAAGRAGPQLHARLLGGTTGRLAFRRAGRPARRPGYGE
jgi:hypothetical protein